MKKIMVYIMMTFIACQVFSQNLNYGINAGINYSSFHNIKSQFGDFDYKLGYQLGFIIENKITEKVGLRFEPGFSQRGAKINNHLTTNSTENLYYFVAPILINYSPFDKFSIILGPEIDYCLASKSIKNGKTTNNKEFFDSKFDIGMNIGISYRMMKKLDVGLRFNRGFITASNNMIFVDSDVILTEELNLFNQGISLLLTYMIK